MSAPLTRRLAGVVVVTGAGSGLGLATVARCSAEGATVVGIDLRPQDALAAGAGAVFAADVTDAAAAHDLALRIEAEIGAVDGLATFAGIEANGMLHETDAEAWRRVLDVNVLGTMHWVAALLPGMRARRRGAIVLVASQLALAGARGCPAYAASKGAILSLTRSLAIDYAADGLRVNALAPGACDTPMLDRAFSQSPPDARARSLARHAMGRFGRAEEVAAAALYLLSDDAAFVTGATLPVDGGWLAA